MRTCVVTKEVLPKKELIRIAATKDGVIKVDLSGKAQGRGAYLKLDEKTINLAKKSKALDRKLGFNVPLEIYEELLKILNA